MAHRYTVNGQVTKKHLGGIRTVVLETVVVEAALAWQHEGHGVQWHVSFMASGAVSHSPMFQKDPEGDIKEFLLQSLTTEEGVGSCCFTCAPCPFSFVNKCLLFNKALRPNGRFIFFLQISTVVRQEFFFKCTFLKFLNIRKNLVSYKCLEDSL